MKYNQEFSLVNEILAMWNPIDVPDNVARTEYTIYVQRILKHRDNLDNIIKELETIVSNEIGLDYHPYNLEEKEFTVKYATKIYEGLKIMD